MDMRGGSTDRRHDGNALNGANDRRAQLYGALSGVGRQSEES